MIISIEKVVQMFFQMSVIIKGISIVVGYTDRRELVKMKVFVLFTFVFSTSLAFEVNLNPKSESDRLVPWVFFQDFLEF